MNHWIIYNDETHPQYHKRGKIISVFEGDQSSAEVCLEQYQSILEGEADPRIHYVDTETHQRTDKSSLTLALSKDTITADGVDEAQLTGLPIPCTVKISEEEVELDDGSLEFSTDMPGIYRVFVTMPASVSEEVTIYAI